ncbi:MAG: hypothetical protein WCC94_12255 [Candidatus Bathyarchaeia archaeon]|jgi:predicted translin family RNA/ssDNA-binding protein
MSSLSKLETCLMNVGTGATGVSLFQEYGVKTPELHYFINYCKKTPAADLSVDMAIAPHQLYLGFPDRITEAYRIVLEKLPCLEVGKPTDKDVQELRRIIEDLYTHLYELYTTVKGGSLQFEQPAPAVHA